MTFFQSEQMADSPMPVVPQKPDGDAPTLQVDVQKGPDGGGPIPQAPDGDGPTTRVDVPKGPDGGGPRRIPCHICKKLVSCGYLDDHIRLHERRFRYHCDLCNKGFMDRRHYNGHKQTHRQTAISVPQMRVGLHLQRTHGDTLSECLSET